MNSAFFFTNLPLGGDGEEGIPQLGQDHPQQIQLIDAAATGNGIGQRRDGGGQLTGIHGITSRPGYAGKAHFVQKNAAGIPAA